MEAPSERTGGKGAPFLRPRARVSYAASGSTKW